MDAHDSFSLNQASQEMGLSDYYNKMLLLLVKFVIVIIHILLMGSNI